jgi:hypothetical protein
MTVPRRTDAGAPAAPLSRRSRSKYARTARYSSDKASS